MEDDQTTSKVTQATAFHHALLGWLEGGQGPGTTHLAARRLKVPVKQKPCGRLWLNDGSCVRLRPERRDHVWSYDFEEARTHDGRSLRLLIMIDEFTRGCLVIRVARRLNSFHVIETLGECMLELAFSEYVRSDNGAEMTARRLAAVAVSVALSESV